MLILSHYVFNVEFPFNPNPNPNLTLTLILTNTSLAILWSSVRALLPQTHPHAERSYNWGTLKQTFTKGTNT